MELPWCRYTAQKMRMLQAATQAKWNFNVDMLRLIYSSLYAVSTNEVRWSRGRWRLRSALRALRRYAYRQNDSAAPASLSDSDDGSLYSSSWGGFSESDFLNCEDVDEVPLSRTPVN